MTLVCIGWLGSDKWNSYFSGWLSLAWFLLVEVTHIFSFYTTCLLWYLQCAVFTRAPVLKIQFQMRMSYHRFNFQEWERFYGKTKPLLTKILGLSLISSHIPAKSCDYWYLSITLANQLRIIKYYWVISSDRLVSSDRFLSICNTLQLWCCGYDFNFSFFSPTYPCPLVIF